MWAIIQASLYPSDFPTRQPTAAQSDQHTRGRFRLLALFNKPTEPLLHAMKTKTRMIAIETWTARSLLNTADSIATPCSVNAYGGCFGYLPRPGSKITICDLREWNSAAVN